MRRSTNENRLVVSNNPDSPVSEAYRTLRTNVIFSSVDKPIKVLMAASAQSGEGKSTVISNLAVAYAQEGKRVLLIDADLRKPSLHKIFSMTNRTGLSNLLSGQCSAAEAVKESYIGKLDVITAGPTPPHPAEMLGSQKMKSYLESVKDEYDMILFDAPPVLAVTDSLIISSLCDGVILVIHAGKVKKAYVRKTKEKLDYVQANIIGAVFNQMPRKDVDYVKYYGSSK
ncbi:CpsD/CapB family tyrosine-protein kinase [Paenibacillus sp. NEAU-GSW1]|uniref:CpsD/CapB family tyrosine-protein kinase n=1 Tax=Paenibacillus sp. NEAU-GSW1 TaxID=2682486 RepID=UPI0012E23006|nr:CpsD/CapB family tyrosine-protein kinase [Paenibacillus sp. NEAU-GSW1]MUT68047.1 polysaccharide biosynthesis tyrosine autokinase [Paenibacillus sp. NEAU-GSW1]